MGTTAKAIESEALALPEDERVRLAMHLLESVEPRSTADPRKVEQAWVAESERRYQAYLAGEEGALSAEEAFRTLRDEDR